jgi:hypothetical protein
LLVYEYFWTRHFENGISESQFDKLTGKEILWGNPTNKIVRIDFTPFDNNLSEMVIRNGVSALPSNLPVHSVEIPDGECYAFKRRITQGGDRMSCSICGIVFEHKKVGEDAVCPQCGTKNEWFCDKCQAFKDTQIRTSRGEVNCPDCITPHGLRIIENIQRVSFVDEQILFYGVHTDQFDFILYPDGSTEMKYHEKQ